MSARKNAALTADRQRPRRRGLRVHGRRCSAPSCTVRNSVVPSGSWMSASVTLKIDFHFDARETLRPHSRHSQRIGRHGAPSRPAAAGRRFSRYGAALHRWCSVRARPFCSARAAGFAQFLGRRQHLQSTLERILYPRSRTAPHRIVQVPCAIRLALDLWRLHQLL